MIISIKPDRTVRNLQGSTFANAMHDLHEVWYRRWKVSRHGIEHKEPIRFWYLTDMSPESIKFYAVAPDGEPVTYLKHRMGRYWPKATLGDAEWNPVSHGDTDVIELGLDKHNMFSLEVSDSRRDTEPLSDILSTLEDFREGDRAVIAYCFEPYDRVSWADKIDNVYKEWNAGKEPKRNALKGRINPMQGLELLNNAMYELHALATGIEGGKDEAKRKDDERNKKPEKKIIRSSNATELSQSTRNKKTQPAFKTWIRLFVTSSDPNRRKVICRSLGNAYVALDGDNQLKSSRGAKSAIDEVNTFTLSRKTTLGFDTTMLSASEVGKLIQLPTAELQDRYSEQLDIQSVTQIDEIPSCFLDPSGIYVGTSEIKGQTYDIHLPVGNLDTLMTSRGFVGSPRQGKDQALINLIVESKRKHGIGAVVLDWVDEHSKDGHGNQRGLSDAIRDSLEPDDFVDLQFSDYDWPIYFGAQMSVQSTLNNRIASDKISKEISDFLMGEETDMHQTFEYLRDASKVCNGDIVDLKRMFTDADFRADKITKMKSTMIGDIDLWETYHKGMSDPQRAAIFSPVNMRLGQILNDEALKPIFCQRPNLNLKYAKWIEEGKVILLRMKMDGESAKVLAHFATMNTFLIKLALGGKGAPTWLVINEPHQVQTKGFIKFIKRILVEGPKYRLAPVVAFHHLGRGHLWPEFVDTLAAANISWHMFYNSNIQTYEKMKSYIEPTFTPDTAMKQTKQFHFIAAGWRNEEGAMQIPFMCKAPDLVKQRWESKDNSRYTKEHSRRYGKPVMSVLNDFRERNRPISKPISAIDERADKPVKKAPPKHVFYRK